MWMDLENIMLSEIRQRQILYDITYMWNLKIQMNLFTKQKQTHRYRNKLVVTEGEREGRRDKLGVWD